MPKTKENKREFDRVTLTLSIIAVIAIATIGTFLLKMEQVDKSRIIQPEQDVLYETQSEPQRETININTASKEELMLLNGIGESKAENIVTYRALHPFKTIQDITKVDGIGKKIYESIADKICVE